MKKEELERLALLLEEAGEVQQQIGKILRHGYDDYHPQYNNNNRSHLETELGDLLGAIHIMANAADLDWDSIDAASARKLDRVQEWMHHQPAKVFVMKRRMKPL